MWREIDGVMHMDLVEAAKRTRYYENHLRRLVGQGKIKAVFQSHNWWLTERAIMEYRAGDSRRKPHAESRRLRARAEDGE